MPAQTYEELHYYTSKIRTRCSECDKVVVGYDEETATLRAKQITERESVSLKYKCVMIAYKGKCGHWHVSRKRG